MPEANRRTALYRLFNSADELLYVGITHNPAQRFSSHASTSPWWPLVVRREICWRASRELAEAEEGAAIAAESPLYNRQHSATPMNLSRDYSDLGEIPLAQFRNRIADTLHEATVRGRITYVTSRGRRIAAVVPIPVAEEIERRRPADQAAKT